MSAESRRRPGLVAGASLLSLSLGVLSLAQATPAVGQAPDCTGCRALLPITVRGFQGSFTRPTDATAPTAPPPTTEEPRPSSVPSVTPATPAGPTVPASETPGASATAGATGTPTLPGQEVRYPHNPNTIVLQIGRTDTSQSSQVFEEMNGTPWFTLYGDGSIIAGPDLFDNDQPLLTASVDELTVQRWLRSLVGPVGLYSLKAEYHHPRAATPEVHVYLFTNDGAGRVSLRSFKQFEQWGVPENLPEAARLQALVAFVRELEAELAGSVLGASTAPFAPDCYTVLAQYDHAYQPVASQFEPWDHSINVRSIAEAAPTAASNYEDKVVGHKFVSGELGREIRALVEPQWRHWFPADNMAAFFKVGGRSYAVGARQEVPGGSLFLPDGGWDNRGTFWYRRDPGSGGCGSLPHRLASPARAEPGGWIARRLHMP